MSNLWLDRPWWRRGLLYHLYLVVLKDNYHRVKRAARWLRVNARVSVRWCVRYLTGRRWTVPLPDTRKVMLTWIRSWAMTAAQVHMERANDNRPLLTGMVVALTAGPNLPPWSPWEYYRSHLQAKPNGAKHEHRFVGRPVVYKYPNGVKIGGTEWRQDYVTRKEMLAARRALKQSRREVA